MQIFNKMYVETLLAYYFTRILTPQSATSTASSEEKSRGFGGTDMVVVVFLDVYGLLWTVREQVG